jgi:hypothetical protein
LFENPLPSTTENPHEICIEENPMAPTEEFQEKIKLTKIEVIAKF